MNKHLKCVLVFVTFLIGIPLFALVSNYTVMGLGYIFKEYQFASGIGLFLILVGALTHEFCKED